MIILGIETSCDETAAAIVENGTEILSNVVASSVELHKKTGGIIPEVAAREQIKCIIPVIQESMQLANGEWRMANGKTINYTPLAINQLDAIAVTVGPGLIGSLLVGVETARTLAYVWQKPIIPINHLQAHIYANFIREIRNPKSEIRNIFPAIGLVVSGGHTDLILIKTHGKIKWLGGTRDDAAGECFDKCARTLGLGYPGGPEIEAIASKFKIQNSKFEINLPRPMINQKNFDFSFSGLKTAVIRQTQNKLSEAKKAALAMEIQKAITDCLVGKTVRAIKKYPVKSILLSGGVAANTLLRETLKTKSQELGIQFFVPLRKFCTDNAAMIASCAFFNYKPIPWQRIKADPSLTVSDKI